MTTQAKLKRDLETVQRALFGDDTYDAEGYDKDGYDREGKDKYGRSREMMEESAKYGQMAFDALAPEKQAVVTKACEIYRKYEEKALEWEKQPEPIKSKAPFYDEYCYHSDITKHSFLYGLWATKEEQEICAQAFDFLFEERKKIDPYYLRRQHP